MAPTTTPARPRRRARTTTGTPVPRGLAGAAVGGAARPAARPAVRGDPGRRPPSRARHGLPPGRLARTLPGTGAAHVRPSPARDPARRRPARPPPHAAAQRFVGMCVEILNGYRPAAHLRPLTHPKHFTAVTDQLIRRTVRVRMPPSHAARQGHLVRVRRMLLCEPLPGRRRARRGPRAGPGRLGDGRAPGAPRPADPAACPPGCAPWSR